MVHLAAITKTGQTTTPGLHYEELWRACAGPMVSLPKLKQLVMYMPQGHIEQIAASTNQDSDCRVPKHDLRPHILCRVMDIQLSAEHETDEVKAQISLLPEPAEMEISDSYECNSKRGEEMGPNRVHIFSKILTASDTSTHGGFSVPRKHAACLPPLDMSQNPPAQDLVATDLHGVKWHFRHIYRGQPKRHLLTTGWSVFVSQKKLLTGDTVIFLRGEDGELRVGIRRASPAQSISVSSVLPCESMHMGVIATATHAILTRTMFSIYYKPRFSPAEFIIPLDRFKSSLGLNLEVGMRFKMRYEAEDGTERRYVGTITGIEDMDTIRWPASKWRSLKVSWDEPACKRDRISPWEIEPSSSTTTTTEAPPLPIPPIPVSASGGPRNKRPHPSVSSSTIATEHSLLSTGTSDAISFKPPPPVTHARVLQGQEMSWALRLIEDDAYSRTHQLRLSDVHSHKKLQQTQLQKPWGEGGSWALGCDRAGEFSPYFDLLQQHHVSKYSSSLTASPVSGTLPSTTNPSAPVISIDRCQSLRDAASPFRHLAFQVPANDITTTPNWFVNPSLLMHNDKAPPCLPSGLLDGEMSKLISPSITADKSHNNNGSYTSCQKPKMVDNDNNGSSRQTCATSGHEGASTGYKLFGFSLMDPPQAKHQTTSEDKQSASALHLSNVAEDESGLASARATQEMSSTSSEPEKLNSGDTIPREGQCKSQLHGGRSCTKVVKKGSIIGRGVDLSKLENYDQLFEELERMFHLQGQLRGHDKGWQVAYSDNENDMLEVGDDPWPEFCNMVKKIHILSREEARSKQSISSA